MSNKTRFFFAIAAVGALLGLIYSGFSTADFVAHLDRQLHPINCTFLPGLTEAQQMGEEVEGCKAALFSPYSSFWREQYWGGVPISLLGLGLFTFALALALWGLLGRGGQAAPLLFLLLSGVIAAGTSVVMFFLSATHLGSFCTLCVGTYLGSGLLLLGAGLAFLGARQDRETARLAAVRPSGGEAAVAAFHEERDARRSFVLAAALLTVELGVCTFLPTVVYLNVLPDYGRHVTSCESLQDLQDPQRVLIPIGKAPGAAAAPVAAGVAGEQALIVQDPLCPACRAFHQRLGAAPRAAQLDYQLLLLPLDAECNWMLADSLHPGSCLLSRALICAGDRARELLELIYDQQDEMRQESNRKELDRLRARVLTRFPELARCLDAPDTKLRLNKTLHFAVKNALPVLTPQLYLNGKRLCDEDTDLGLDYSLAHLLASPAGAATRPTGGPPAPAVSPGAPTPAPTTGAVAPAAPRP